MTTASTPSWMSLWGKAQPGDSVVAWHPLAYHMLDVAAVAAELWERRVSRTTSARLAEVFVDPAAAVVVAAAFHDLGKATPTFQRMVPDAWGRLADVGLTFPELDERYGHGVLTDALAADLLSPHLNWDARLLSQTLAVAAGHHGNTLEPPMMRRRATLSGSAGDQVWDAARRDLVAALVNVLPSTPAKVDQLPVAVGVLLGGLIVAADWIGSNTDWFPYEPPMGGDLSSYWVKARRRASVAVDALYLVRWTPPRVSSWVERFPEQPNPRPLQDAAVSLAAELDGPAIVVVEADTGEGKTEAAWWIAEQLVTKTGASGVYVALPTRATADQMFGRVGRFVAADSVVQLALCHGTSTVSAAIESLRNDPWTFHADDVDRGNPSTRVVADSWFSSSKRGLLSPVGVGTVDQLVIAAQQARFWWLRMFAVTQSTLIIDEAHAYDTYQQAILETLLYWCGLCGTSVVILSATLPTRTREALLAAWYRGAGGDALPAGTLAGHYPALTAVTASGRHEMTFLSARPRRTPIEWVAPIDRADTAIELARNGDSVLVVCNTVARAQTLYQEISAKSEGSDVLCYHARFPMSVRAGIHAEVESRWGPHSHRTGGICVATQVVEQSLDVDFDWLITDLAPVDLLVQRRGRTRRHPARTRSAAARATDVVRIVAPDLADGVPVFDRGTAAVYDSYILARTYLELLALGAIETPTDTRRLVDSVYDDSVLTTGTAALDDALLGWWSKWNDLLAGKLLEADLQQITSDVSSVIEPRAAWGARLLDEDSGALFRARARLGEDSVQAVCVLDAGDGVLHDLASGAVLCLSPGSSAQVRDLVRAACPLPARFGAELEQPSSWAGHGTLLRYRVIRVRPDGSTTHPQLTYDDECGFRTSYSTYVRHPK